MIQEAILSWAMMATSGGYSSTVVIYFQTQELCEKARLIINLTDGNQTYARTKCFRIRE